MSQEQPSSSPSLGGFFDKMLPPLGPLMSLNGAPIRSEYKDDMKRWRMDTTRYYITRSGDRMLKKHAMQRLSIDMYLSVTENQKIPSYASLPGTDHATSSVAYEHLNPIFQPIKKRVGQFQMAEMDIEADIINKGAQSRKEKFKTEAFITAMLGDAQPMVEEFVGPMANPQQQIKDEGFTGTIDEYLETDYKDIYARKANKLIRDWVRKSRFKQTLDQIYMYYALTQTAIIYPRINYATLETETYVEDPTQFIFDLDMQDDYGRDMQYIIRARYVSENEILHCYPGITREELRELHNAGNTLIGYRGWGLWKNQNNIDYYLLADARWIYTEDVSVKEAKAVSDDVDIEEIQDTDENKETISFEQVYYSVSIGGVYELSGGVLPNQVRSVDVYSKASLGVFVLSLGHSLSPLAPTNLMRVESLVKMRNMLFYKATSMIADIKGVVLEVDESLLPRDNEGTPDKKGFMLGLLSDKVVFRDSTEASMSMDAANLKAQELMTTKTIGLPVGLEHTVSMINLVTTQINEIMGSNDAGMGRINQYQNATSAQINLTAYEASMAYEDVAFNKLVEMALDHIANQEKILDTLRADRADSIGDTEVADAIAIRNGDDVFYVDEDHFIFQDLGINLRVKSNSAELASEMQMALQAGIQQGSISIDEFIEYRSYDNPYEGMHALKQHLKKKRIAQEQLAAQQQEQAMAAAQQQQQQQVAMQSQLEQQKIIAEMQADMAKTKQSEDLKARNSAINNQVNAENQRANQLENIQKELIDA